MMDFEQQIRAIVEQESSPAGVVAEIVRKVSPETAEKIFGPRANFGMTGRFRAPNELELLASAGDCIVRLMNEKAELEERLAIALAAKPAPKSENGGGRL